MLRAAQRMVGSLGWLYLRKRGGRIYEQRYEDAMGKDIYALLAVIIEIMFVSNAENLDRRNFSAYVGAVRWSICSLN